MSKEKLNIEILDDRDPSFVPQTDWRDADRAKSRKIKGRKSVPVSGHGVRIDGAGILRLTSPKTRMIGEVWSNSDAVNHVELLPGAPVRVTIPSGFKLTVRIA